MSRLPLKVGGIYVAPPSDDDQSYNDSELSMSFSDYHPSPLTSPRGSTSPGSAGGNSPSSRPRKMSLTEALSAGGLKNFIPNRLLPNSAKNNINKRNETASAAKNKGGTLSTSFTPMEKKYFKKMFDMYDSDHSGAIGFYEMKNMCRHLGVEISDENLRQSMEDLDENGNGELEFDEFMHWLRGVGGDGSGGRGSSADGADEWAVLKSKIRAKGTQPLTNKQIAEFRKVFDHFDTDGSGTIDVAELRAGFEAMGQSDITDEQIQELMAQVDDDRSGEIDFDEFLLLMSTGFNKSDGNIAEGVEEILLKTLREHDASHSGLISTRDLETVIATLTKGQMPEAEIKAIVKEIGMERGDGYVEYLAWEGLWEACRGVK